MNVPEEYTTAIVLHSALTLLAVILVDVIRALPEMGFIALVSIQLNNIFSPPPSLISRILNEKNS